MKRIKGIYPGICEYDNLCLAFCRAARGKRRRPDVMAFEGRFQDNIETLRQQLINETPAIGHYRYFTVYDPKLRSICAASFPERVLHHAVMNLCEPVFEKKSVFDSYACRKDKGSYKAIDRAQQFCKQFEWYLKIDIEKYFDSVDHQVMMTMLGRYFKDRQLLGLFRKILDTYETQPGKGMPIGNLISQHFANVYLTAFDRFMKENRRIRGYVRYMDDTLIFGRSKAGLKTELKEMTDWLDTELKLKIKGSIQLNRTTKGIPFLGYRVFSSHLMLTAGSRNRMFKKFRRYERRWLEGGWDTHTLVRHVAPLMSFATKAKTTGLRNDMIKRYGVWS